MAALTSIDVESSTFVFVLIESVSIGYGPGAHSTSCPPPVPDNQLTMPFIFDELGIPEVTLLKVNT